MANRTAQDAVERAGGSGDRGLDHSVGKGNRSGPVISHSPIDDRPVIYPPAVPDARVGRPQQQLPDRRPDLTQPFPGGSANRGPELGSQIGSSDDTFEVYRGGGEYPLDTPPVWRYIAKGCWMHRRSTRLSSSAKQLRSLKSRASTNLERPRAATMHKTVVSLSAWEIR
jgi:hypothetical protein